MDQEDKAKELLDQLWRKHLPEMRARLEILRDASDQLQQGQLTEETRQSAQSAAHKLAGALGTFGRAEGTDLARMLESCFTDSDELSSAKDRIEAAVRVIGHIIAL